ncbi:hemerythrin [Ornithinibacillus gellani]|nr:hemerythrin [Ornithinibacillus gellani]
MIALHLALKLKRAGTAESRLTEEEIWQELKEFWEPSGQEHFREEEEILLTAFAQYAEIRRPEIIDMLLEHIQIRAKIATLLHAQDIDIHIMHELGKLLEAHVRKEERIIFPLIEKTLPEEKLIELAPYLE